MRQSANIILVISVCLFAALASGGCTYNDTTGEYQLNAIDRDAEIALGAEATPQLIKDFGGEISDGVATGYLNEIGTLLASMTEGEDPGLPWEFILLDSDVINAFALPGGKVFLSAGLARAMQTEAELAGVLGHEIGHVTARHANEGLQRQVGITAFSAALAAALGSQLDDAQAAALASIAVGTSGQLVGLSYDRRQESEADALGIRYMTRAGYNPVGMLGLMRVLQQESEKAGSRRLPIFSTHPLPQTRIDRVKKTLEEHFPLALAGPTVDTFPERYRRRMLERLPPPGAEASIGRRASFVASSHGSWCATCRRGEGPG